MGSVLCRIAGIAAICALTTGCWDSAEIDQLAIATASGVDVASHDGSGGQSLDGYLQVAVPSALGTTSGGGPSSGTGTTESFVLVEGSGKNVGDALDKARTKISRKLIMSHRRVTIVGEDYAKQGVNDLLDEITRNPSSRLRTVLLVAYHDTAHSILKLPYPLERLPQEAVVGLTKQSSSDEFTVKNFITEQGKGDPYTLGIEHIEFAGQSKSEGFAIRHIGVFHKDKLVGWLDGQDFDNFLWLRGVMRGKVASVVVPGHPGMVDCKLLKTKTIRKAHWVGEKPMVSIRVESRYDVIKNGTDLDLRNPRDISIVESALSKQMTSGMKSTLSTLQQQLHADPVGLANEVYETSPKRWHQIEKEWDAIYSQLPVEISTDVSIRRSGLISSNIKE